MANKKDEMTALKRPQLSISHSNRFFSGFCSFFVIRELFLLLIKIPLTSNLSRAYFPSHVALISPSKSLLPTSPCISLTFSLFKPASSFSDNSKLNQTDSKEAKVRRPFTHIGSLAPLGDQMVPTPNLCPPSGLNPEGGRDCPSLAESSIFRDEGLSCCPECPFARNNHTSYCEDWKTESQN